MIIRISDIFTKSLNLSLLNLSTIKMITNYFDVGGSVILARVYNQS